MVSEIRIYIEGDNALRPGFSLLFGRLIGLARPQGIRFRSIPSGSRDSTFDDFKTALISHPEASNILLVDSEDPVDKPPWQHLKERDGWERPPGVTDEQCHLMVPCMEAWFIADVVALRSVYQRGLNENPLPKRQNVEENDKHSVMTAIHSATRNASPAGYHKVTSARKLLGSAREIELKRRAPHCDRLFSTLEGLIVPTAGLSE